MKYPEHGKMVKVKDESRAIGSFIEIMSARGFDLCGRTGYEEYRPIRKSIEEILADYFEIDLNKIEAEKVAMLDEFREATSQVQV